MHSDEAIKRFDRNVQGRDFVVGDIHGMFRALDYKLSEVHFDEQYDRLFSVGDLIDRGPDSAEFEAWLSKPWFHAVRGNHEQMLIDSMKEGFESNIAGIYYANGGDWFFGLPEVEQQCYAIQLDELPYAIEIDTPQGKVGLVHAEVPLNDWELFKSLYDDNEDYFNSVLIWSRNRISSKYTEPVNGIDVVFCGHTPVKEITYLGNVVYLDTGAVFKGGKLSLVQIN